MTAVRHRNKRFDKKTHSQYDNSAKQVAIEYLQSIGATNIRENIAEGKDFSEGLWDVRGTLPDGTERIIESEIKNDYNWRTKWKATDHREVPYPWNGIHFPERKIYNSATHMMIVRADLECCFVVSAESVKKSEKIEKYCRNTNMKEPFFDVQLPCSDSGFYRKIDGEWKCVRWWDQEGNLTISE